MGNLFEYLVSQFPFKEKTLMKLMKNTLQSAAYIHSKGIMHRDIKLENIMLVDDETLDLKIIDFGLSTRLDQKDSIFTDCGTPGYIAPEIIYGHDYNEKVDIFSI